jgi:hypothetical protein
MARLQGKDEPTENAIITSGSVKGIEARSEKREARSEKREARSERREARGKSASRKGAKAQGSEGADKAEMLHLHLKPKA